MKIEEILKKIDESKEIVKDVEEPYKIPTFQVVLSKLLENSIPIHKKEDPKSETKPKESKKDGLEELAKKCNVTIDQMNDFIILKDDGTAELLIKFDKNMQEKEKQTKGSQCIIIALEFAMGDDWIDPVKLAKSIERSGISSSHLSRTLDGNNRIFKSTGSRRGKKYKLSGPGRSETFELIQKLVEQQ